MGDFRFLVTRGISEERSGIRRNKRWSVPTNHVRDTFTVWIPLLRSTQIGEVFLVPLSFTVGSCVWLVSQEEICWGSLPDCSEKYLLSYKFKTSYWRTKSSVWSPMREGCVWCDERCVFCFFMEILSSWTMVTSFLCSFDSHFPYDEVRPCLLGTNPVLPTVRPDPLPWKRPSTRRQIRTFGIWTTPVYTSLLCLESQHPPWPLLPSRIPRLRCQSPTLSRSS